MSSDVHRQGEAADGTVKPRVRRADPSGAAASPETGALVPPARSPVEPTDEASRAAVTAPGAPARPQTVTLKDVARAVGISQSAVSMALADSSRISPATKDAVRAAVKSLGYVPNSAGRALRAGRAASIAVVVPNTGQHMFGHPYFMHLLVGVTAAANAHDVALMISTNPDETHGVAAYERVLRSRAASGAIVASASINDTNVNRMVDAALPVVLIGRYPQLPHAVSVGVDEVAGAMAITLHLVQQHGLRRIAHISGPLDHQPAIDRYEGFTRALAESGQPCTHTLAVGDFSEESGRAAARQVLDTMSDVQAIFAANDEMAYGALLELRSRGLRVPEDIALAGYDDFGISRLVTPGLTTVHVPAEALGQRAAALLFDLVEGTTPVRTHTVLPAEIVVRDSCGTHPA
ncbi:LacI family DNA-binding transcriptional regulator [Rugosimonospora africana]|uniref:LacI family transcriptional regulator n=1 Tax=Rugosimonospora africana TaxID=556532 RepID=A0A8J3QV66_9ACTN|nr:LacI family DNA-binding transcriptional regulator [Rugosimonospora africana]GIH16697.1 LacI family transcriptional regulator [Rugosimonospora africana]